jgi:hypothetical protein
MFRLLTLPLASHACRIFSGTFLHSIGNPCQHSGACSCPVCVNAVSGVTLTWTSRINLAGGEQSRRVNAPGTQRPSGTPLPWLLVLRVGLVSHCRLQTSFTERVVISEAERIPGSKGVPGGRGRTISRPVTSLSWRRWSIWSDPLGAVHRAAAQVPGGRLGTEVVLERISSLYTGSAFSAALELWVAARTDAGLRAAVVPLEPDRPGGASAGCGAPWRRREAAGALSGRGHWRRRRASQRRRFGCPGQAAAKAEVLRSPRREPPTLRNAGGRHARRWPLPDRQSLLASAAPGASHDAHPRGARAGAEHR